ncbi:uncharacterized protein B0H18DRAFT_1106609 [Fomitopsis serialis]|uniref:uncharacterized protein n=1 Tax=Fomitopsis serialis TaxID=139415 RepID=UPI00200760B4|nr:uncharacterized protein B0H18DRAFT_1106609 [Neoantrodia serialis]KAH9919530.1 hypothetical protein B0H18DRAFT_1106609 [Neoantrodia serialis]
MRHSAVFSVLLAAATAAPALALPIAFWSRGEKDETLYERGLEDNFWARDVMPRGGGPRPLPATPKPKPRPLPPTPKPKSRPLPRPPTSRRSLSDAELEERGFDEECLFQRSFDNEEAFWARDLMPRSPPPGAGWHGPRRMRREVEELFARAMEIGELD